MRPRFPKTKLANRDHAASMQPKHSIVLVWMISTTIVRTGASLINSKLSLLASKTKQYHEKLIENCYINSHVFLKPSTNVSLALPVFCRTQCVSYVHGQWLAETRHDWLPAWPIYDLSSWASNSFWGSSVHTMSASLPSDSAKNINLDLAGSSKLSIF